MKGFFSNKYIIILTIISIILLLAMAFLTTGRDEATLSENAAGVITTPLQTLVQYISESTVGFFGYFQDKKEIEDQNKYLTDYTAELENRIRELESFDTENKRLRDLLDIKEDMRQYTTVAAQVVAKDPGNWYHTFTINKGTLSGLNINQAVLTAQGLVGHISEIGYTWAKVETIIDSDSSISATIVRTSNTAIAEGDVVYGIDGYCKLSYLDKDADLTTGDLIETSGIGGVYPKGILIGKVVDVKTDMHGVSQYALLEPVSDLKRLNEVLVVTEVK